jgi:hypothetical protein
VASSKCKAKKNAGSSKGKKAGTMSKGNDVAMSKGKSARRTTIMTSCDSICTLCSTYVSYGNY